MKPGPPVLFLAGVLLGLCSCASRHDSASSEVPVYDGLPVGTYVRPETPLVTTEAVSDSSWPLTLAAGATNLTVYEPQVDWWDGHSLVARSAVAVQSANSARAVYGVISLQGTTIVDKTQRSAALEDPKITSADFPSAHRDADRYLHLIRATFPKEIKGLSLDQLEASLTLGPQEHAGAAPALNNTPPRIIISSKPSVLVSIDGPPVYRPVPQTDLERVINTRVLLLKDRIGRHYLRLSDREYLQAPDLDGPWTLARQLPQGAQQAEKTSSTAMLLEGSDMPANAPAGSTLGLTSTNPPVIYLSTQPAELITFDGSPTYLPIEGTHLLYAANTTANLFKSLTDQRSYVLLAGRWFSAPSLDGPWQFIPGRKLPADFAQIPDSSPKENVKASVPGTSQAAEALIANSIPQSGKIARTTTMQDPQIDGPPLLKPIEGTPLYYVINSGTPIIKVDDQSWFACQNGVWFTAGAFNGPWTVAASVPGVIYTIPVTSPLHYLTYVRVYGANPEAVYEGYTPGYFGTEVSPDGTVVYGTGYSYPPWVGDVWYGEPVTWGLGWDPFWTPWDDWGFGFGYGWGCGFGRLDWWRCHPPVPGWGPYRHWQHGSSFAGRNWNRGGWVNTTGRIYGRSGRLEMDRGFGGRAMASGYGHAYNSRTGALLAGRRGDLKQVPGAYQRWASTGTSWTGAAPSHGGVSGTFLNHGSPGAPNSSRLPFSSSSRSMPSLGYGHSLPFSASRPESGLRGAVSGSHSGSYFSGGRSSGSFGGRGSFSYGGEAFSFPHSGSGLSFSHGSGTTSFRGGAFSGSHGGGSSFGGGSFGGGHGGGGGSSGGGHGGGGSSGGGGGHR